MRGWGGGELGLNKIAATGGLEFTIFDPVKPVLFLAPLLASLVSCQQTVPAKNLLLGHWQCDSLHWVHLDKMGREREPWTREGKEFYMTVTPTHVRVFVPFFPTADSSTYKEEEFASAIKLLNAESLVIERADTIRGYQGARTGIIRTRYFYHRQQHPTAFPRADDIPPQPKWGMQD